MNASTYRPGTYRPGTYRPGTYRAAVVRVPAGPDSVELVDVAAVSPARAKFG